MKIPFITNMLSSKLSSQKGKIVASAEGSQPAMVHAVDQITMECTAPGFERLFYRDPLELKKVDFSQLSIVPEGVWIERPAGRYPDKHYQPFFHDKATPEGITNLNVGLPHVRPAVFIAKLQNVFLSGCRGIISQDGSFCFDESFPTKEACQVGISQLGAPEAHLNQWMNFSSTEVVGEYKFNSKAPVIELNEPIVLLTSLEGPNFGSFIFRMLPKVVHLARFDKNFRILVPLYSDTFRQFLLAAGVAEDRLIHHNLGSYIYKIKELYIPSIRNADVWFDDESLALFDQLRMRHGRPQEGRRIYLSRRDIVDHSRKMLNEPELIETLLSRGFEIVSPELLSATDQIEVFSSASIIIAAAGSAIYNAAFCYPGTTFIDIESEPHWIHGHVRIFSSRGLRYGVYEGERQDNSGRPHVPFYVNIPRLVTRLDEILAESDPSKSVKL